MKFFSKFKKVNVFLILFAFIGTIFLSSFSKLVLADENEYVLTNVLNGLIPTTNSKHMIISGDSTVPQVSILHPDSATDGDNSSSNDDSLNTKVIVVEETGGLDNGYSKWEPVFLQYDFKKIRPVKEIKIYRNTYDNAISTFKF